MPPTPPLNHPSPCSSRPSPGVKWKLVRLRILSSTHNKFLIWTLGQAPKRMKEKKRRQDKRCVGANVSIRAESKWTLLRTHLAPHESMFPLYKELVMRSPAEHFVKQCYIHIKSPAELFVNQNMESIFNILKWKKYPSSCFHQWTDLEENNSSLIFLSN